MLTHLEIFSKVCSANWIYLIIIYFEDFTWNIKNQVNCQPSTYPYIKDIEIEWKYFQDGIFCHFLASMFSGLVTTIASMPVDIAKTRLQNQKIIDGKKMFFDFENHKTSFFQANQSIEEQEMCWVKLSRMKDSSPYGKASLPTTSVWVHTLS